MIEKLFVVPPSDGVMGSFSDHSGNIYLNNKYVHNDRIAPEGAGKRRLKAELQTWLN